MRSKGTIFSEVLDVDTNLNIISPDNYLRGEKYKAVYLLHGMSGDANSFFDYTMLANYANKYDAIFVMPEVGNSYYNNIPSGKKFFSYITEELPEICKSVYNISDKREDTSIMGFSMGGYGALKCALTYPENYALCCTFASGGLFLKEYLEELRAGKVDKEKFKNKINNYKYAFGEDFSWNEDIEILSLAKKIAKQSIKPKIYSVCGRDDSLFDKNKLFADEMNKLDFDFTFEETEGDHNFEFVNKALKSVLEKYF